MVPLLAALTLFAARLLPLAAAASSNQFVSPSPNDGDHTHIEGTFAEGSLIRLQWETTWTTLALVLWQDGTPQFQYLPNSGTPLLLTGAGTMLTRLKYR